MTSHLQAWDMQKKNTVGSGTQPKRGECSWYLAQGALGAIQGRPFLGLAEVRVVRVAAPQLLAGVKSTELQSKQDIGVDIILPYREPTLKAGEGPRLLVGIGRGDRDWTAAKQQHRDYTHSCAGLVAHTKVKAALFIHGVVNARQLRERGPLVLKGIIQQAVVGTAGRGRSKGFPSFSHIPTQKSQFSESQHKLPIATKHVS